MNTVISKQIGSFAVIAIVLVIAFLIWSNNIFAGKSPTNIGVNNGRLAACPATPNCVSSQAPASDTQHAIAPLSFSSDAPTTMAKLKQAIAVMPRTNIIKETNDYLYVEFASKLMGFVDDVEFYLDNETKTIQVRSASRLGESDLGVNRQRIEEIRSKLAS
jgi:uncharacterized protein (DUF1499 family)